jgi:hypothetical protein
VGQLYGGVILGLFGLFLGAVFGGWRGRMVQDVFELLEPARAPDSDTGRRDW